MVVVDNPNADGEVVFGEFARWRNQLYYSRLQAACESLAPTTQLETIDNSKQKKHCATTAAGLLICSNDLSDALQWHYKLF